ncbi:MAG: LLM class F420-dependent oxidoreductase [Myxococcota bacterium]
MKVDMGLFGNLEEIPRRIRELEEEGYDAVMTAETSSDPFFPLLIAAEHSERIELLTSIAVAFARTPMTLAHVGHDLNNYSKGRFILGLGSQIRPHITRRFSMPWSKPAARMREFIQALHAIWDCWHKGEKLNFRGEFYTHSLMTPMFSPSANEFGPPRVFLAAVGPLMTEVAGEVADGMLVHPFSTEQYIREVTMPAIERGLARGGKKRSAFEITGSPFIITGTDEESQLRSRSSIAQQLAFYGSTPAYRPVLDMHGWGDVQEELNVLSKRGEWVKMATLMTDEMLEKFAIIGKPEEIAPKLKARYGDLFDRVACTAPFEDPAARREFIETLRK